tara:strand:- start:2128 stop:3546 length:1419 start_codon:yes stop_codon:yes gene_type:complete
MEDFSKFVLTSARDLGADWAEVRNARERGTFMSFNNDVADSSGFSDVESIFARFLVGNSMGTVYLENPSKSRIVELLKRQIAVVETTAKINQRGVLLSEERAIKKTHKIRQLIPLMSVSDEKKQKYLAKLHKTLSTKIKHFDSSSVNLSTTNVSKYYLNSDGTAIKSEIPKIEFYYIGTINNGKKSTQQSKYLSSTSGWEGIRKWKLDKQLVSSGNSLGKVLDNGVKSPRGKMDIVVGSEVSAIMAHESVGHPFEADRILGRESAQAGESYVNESMVGKKIASELVTIVDNPLVKGSAGYYIYDEEGVPAKERVLVKKGNINEFLHDRSTASTFGVKSNGASRSSYNLHEPIVRMGNTYVLPGKTKEHNLIKDVKKGVLMRNFMEWNIDDTRMAFKARGNEAYLIENGEVTKPILFPILEIKSTDLWKSVEGIGNKKSFALHSGPCGKGEPMQGIPVGDGGPSLLLRGVNIS